MIVFHRRIGNRTFSVAKGMSEPDMAEVKVVNKGRRKSD